MLLIRCPHCGERPEPEFAYGGEAHIARPADPAAVSDDDWAAYLWASRIAYVDRDTTTDHFIATYKAGEKPPEGLR